MGRTAEVHFFSTDYGKLYCLDVNSSAIFAVDEIAAEVIRRLTVQSLDQIAASLSRKHPRESVVEAIEAIQGLQANGFFGTNTKREQIEVYPNRYELNLLGLSLFVSNLCNLNCIYCFNDGGTLDKTTSSFMRPETADRAVDFLLQNSEGLVGIDFFGGEPLLNFKLIKHIIEYSQASGRHIQYSMITNGTLLTDDMLELFGKYVFHIVVSYDGYLQNVQRPAKNGQDLRDRVRSNIRALAQRLPRSDISIRCILTHDMQSLELLADEAVQLGVRIVPGLVTLPQESTMNLTVADVERLKAFEAAYLSGSLKAKRVDCLTGVTNIVNTLTRIMHSKQRYYSCGIGKDILAVSSNGDIYPCHRFAGLADFRMGSVLEGINAETYRMYADLFVDNRESCSTCWARYFCGGGCAHEAYVYEADPTRPAPSRCELIRYEIELGLKLYAITIDEQPELLEEIGRSVGN